MTRRAPLALCFVLIASAALTAQAQRPQEPPPHPQERAPLGTRPAPEEFNPSATVVFVTNASQDARTELALAKLAQQKSDNAKVKEFARKVEADHQNAELQLQQLAKSKKMTLPADATPAQTAAVQRMENLSGEAFDRAYVELAVTDHKNAIRDFEKAARSPDVDVKMFASRALPTLRKHLDAAQALLNDVK